MPTRIEHARRKQRESLSKRLGKLAQRIFARDWWACLYCGTTRMLGAQLQLDHLNPDGPDVAINLVTACRRCNSSRKRMKLSVWCAAFGLQSSWVRRWARRRLPE